MWAFNRLSEEGVPGRAGLAPAFLVNGQQVAMEEWGPSACLALSPAPPHCDVPLPL